MTRTFTTLFAIAALAAGARSAEKSLALKDLPPAVQKTIQDQTKNAEIKNIGKETEHGVAQYEVETMVNGKHRDFNVDTKGALVVVEEETTIDTIPAAAKAAIEKKVGGGKLGMVEIMTKGTATFYEAAYTDKGGKKKEARGAGEAGRHRNQGLRTHTPTASSAARAARYDSPGRRRWLGPGARPSVRPSVRPAGSAGPAW